MSNFENSANHRYVSGDYKRNGVRANQNVIPESRPLTESQDYRSYNGPRQSNQYISPRSGPVIYRNKESPVSGSNRNSYPTYSATRSKQKQLPENEQSHLRVKNISPPAESVGYRNSYEDDKGLSSRNAPSNHRYSINQNGNQTAGHNHARNQTSTDPHNQPSSHPAIPDNQRTRPQGQHQNHTQNILASSEINRNRNVHEKPRQYQRSESLTDNNMPGESPGQHRFTRSADFTERNLSGQQRDTFAGNKNRAEISQVDEKNRSVPNAAGNRHSAPLSNDYSNQMQGQQFDRDRIAGDHSRDNKVGYLPPEPLHQYNEYGYDPKRSMGNNSALLVGRRDESNDNQFRRFHVTEHTNDVGVTKKKPLIHDDMWPKTRELDGIPLLVELISNNFPQVHRKACDALKNLSFGETNDDIKIAIKNAGGVLALSQLLNSSKDDEVKELITEALWNLSSCEDLQMSIIDNGLKTLVNKNIIPHRNQLPHQTDPTGHWKNVFLHTTGIIRNVSSAGFNARMRLRECDGLIESIIDELQSAIQRNEYGGKCIENCVVILRNLSYRLQEVDDPDFHLKRSEMKEQTSKGKLSLSTLFSIAGMVRKKKIGQRKDAETSGSQGLQLMVLNRKGVDALWQPTILSVYLQLIRECSNLLTVEAALGAIQNLTAYEWQPAIDVRSNVRIQKGLPIIAECLSAMSDKVVCCAANLLRNLAFDLRNRDLLGKHVMLDLVAKLSEYLSFVPVSEDVVCAILVTMYELVKGSADSAKSLLNEGGVNKLLLITQSEGKYLPRTIKYGSTVLQSMWKYKALHYEYLRNEFTKQQFMTVPATPRVGSSKGLKDGSLITSSINDTGPNAFSLLQPIDKRSKKHSSSMIDIRWHSRPSVKASEDRTQRNLHTFDEQGEHRNATDSNQNHIQINRQNREDSRTQYPQTNNKHYQQEPPQFTREEPYRTPHSREDLPHENHSPYGQSLIPSLVGTKSPRGGSWI